MFNIILAFMSFYWLLNEKPVVLTNENIKKYCEHHIDTLSYLITHNIATDEYEKYYMMGQMSAYENIHNQLKKD